MFFCVGFPVQQHTSFKNRDLMRTVLFEQYGRGPGAPAGNRTWVTGMRACVGKYQNALKYIYYVSDFCEKDIFVPVKLPRKKD